MKLNFSRTFFVPLVVVVSILSLTSCGKDYDLVSEYVVRDATNKLQVSNTLNSNTSTAAVMNNISSVTVKKSK